MSFSEIQKVEVVKQILQAINYIHKQGIAHWDLKKDNILISIDLKVKLADFGFSKDFFNELLFTKKGSPLYIAPEILKKSNEAYT